MNSTQSHFFINLRNDGVVITNVYNEINPETPATIDRNQNDTGTTKSTYLRWWLGGGILLTVCIE